MQRVLLVFVLMLFTLSSHADERLFYQPQSSDAAITSAQWKDIWQQSLSNGVHTLIVQWTRYGEEDFGGETGWLASALREADQQGLKLILGLSFDPHYYHNLPNNRRFSAYWHQQLSQALKQYSRLTDAWQFDPEGWYLPYELDDHLFRDSKTRRELEHQMKDFVAQLDKPLHMSAFTGGLLSPAVNAEWLSRLVSIGINLWWQDGRGTAVLAPRVLQAYENELDCRIGIIREAFRKTSQSDNPFKANPAEPLHTMGCHENAVFSLRYRPWGNILIKN